MNASTRSLVLQICLAVASATPALAVRIPPFTAADEASCQQEIGREEAKLLSAAVKSWARCYGREGGGHDACTSIPTTADEARLRTHVTRKCESVAGFWRLGLGANVAEALDMVVPGVLDAAREIADRAYALTYGAPGVQPIKTTDPDLFRCLARLGKEARTIGKGALGINARCLDQDDSEQVTNPSGLPRCDEGTRIAKLANLIDGAVRRIETTCTGDQLLAATGDASAQHFADSAESNARKPVCGAYPYARNAAICPCETGQISLRTLGGTTDIGWKAQAHGGIIPESLPREVELVCCRAAAGVTTCNLYASRNGQVAFVAPGGEIPNSDPPNLIALVGILTTDLMGSISFDDALQITNLKITQGQDVNVKSVGEASNFPFCRPDSNCSGIGSLGDPGTCCGGATPGAPCTVEAVFLPEGPTSTDCLPFGGPVGFATIRPELTTVQSAPVSLTAAFQCRAGGLGGLCHCAGFQAYPNECSDEVCGLDETCAQEPSTSCFPDTITRTGAAEPLTVVAVGCVPSAGVVDDAIGLPGPFAVAQQIEVEITIPPN